MKHRLGILLMVFGVISVLSSAGIILYNIIEDNRVAETSARTAQELFVKIEENAAREQNMELGVVADKSALPDNEQISGALSGLRSIEIDGTSYIGVLSIPLLELALPVSSTWSYPKLRNSPCRYTGSMKDNTLVIVAHNYKNHFGNIEILMYGDNLMMMDTDGNEYLYQVVENTIVEPTDIVDTIHSEFDLTLITCTYSGQARIAVRCMRTVY